MEYLNKLFDPYTSTLIFLLVLGAIYTAAVLLFGLPRKDYSDDFNVGTHLNKNKKA